MSLNTPVSITIDRHEAESLRLAGLAMGRMGEAAVDLFDGPGSRFSLACDDIEALIARCEEALLAVPPRITEASRLIERERERYHRITGEAI